MSCTVSPLWAVLSLHQEGSSQLPKAPVVVGGILLVGPSPAATLLLPTVPPLPWNLALGVFLLAPHLHPPLRVNLGPGPYDLMCVTLFGNPRAASPSTVLHVEPAGLDAAPGQVSSWGSVVVIAMEVQGISLRS